MKKNLSKTQCAKQTSNTNIEKFFRILQDKSNSENVGKEAKIAEIPLKRHKKDCFNENRSFQVIRQIADFSQAVDAIPSAIPVESRFEWLKDSQSRPQSQQPKRNQRQQKPKQKQNREQNIQIEQEFVIADSNYSDQSQKIRDSRHGLPSSTATPTPTSSNQSTGKTFGSISPEDNEWKQRNREDLAMKLTKAKLYEIFPNVDRQQLLEVFQLNGFSRTVDFFKESLKSEIDIQTQAKDRELATKSRVEAQAMRPPQSTDSKRNKHNIASINQGMTTLDKLDREDAKRAALRDFEENRNMAMHHLHLKAECYNKAREAFQRKQKGVAYYYTTVADLHNTKIDTYNSKAANAIVEVHSFTQQDPNMLDLHYLHTDEAVECLDNFIDRHIDELKNAKRGFKYVFIITGRGLHSTRGFSIIKHRVKFRLEERTLSYAEVNPGLLKVKLQYTSLFTENVDTSVNINKILD